MTSPHPSFKPTAQPQSGAGGVRAIVTVGIFKRILLIELSLLAVSLVWRGLQHGVDPMDLLVHSLRIVLLIVVTIAFVTFSLRKFLDRHIIQPLEAISQANERLDSRGQQANSVDLSAATPNEIVTIVQTRQRMLDDLFKVSVERLRLAEAMRDTLGRYLSKKVVDEILDAPNGHALAGRKAIVTILMADLRGFTQLSEIKDVRETVRFLNRFFDAMTRIILAYDGMIDEFLGDGILTIFGVPENHPDDAARAVACAVEMQNRISTLNQEIAEEGYPPVSMGIGITTGTVIVGNIGSELRAKYGIVGKAVNVAGRIESMTPSGQIWINDTTYHLLKPDIVVDPPQPLMVKGLSQPVVCYPVKAMGQPYAIKLIQTANEEQLVEIRLPFTCWVIDQKMLVEPGLSGETLYIDQTVLKVVLERALRPQTQLKVQFDFCTEAHCFSPIFASLIDSETIEGRPIQRLRITDIEPTDRDLLTRWIKEAA